MDCFREHDSGTLGRNYSSPTTLTLIAWLRDVVKVREEQIKRIEAASFTTTDVFLKAMLSKSNAFDDLSRDIQLNAGEDANLRHHVMREAKKQAMRKMAEDMIYGLQQRIRVINIVSGSIIIDFVIQPPNTAHQSAFPLLHPDTASVVQCFPALLKMVHRQAASGLGPILSSLVQLDFAMVEPAVVEPGIIPVEPEPHDGEIPVKLNPELDLNLQPEPEPEPEPALVEPGSVPVEPEPQDGTIPVDLKPEPEPEPALEPEPEPELEPELDLEPEPELERRLEAEPEPELDSESQPQLDLGPQPELEPKPASQPKLELKLKPETEPRKVWAPLVSYSPNVESSRSDEFGGVCV